MSKLLRILLLALFVAVGQLVCAQPNICDSLLSVLKEADSDESKFNVLIELAKATTDFSDKEEYANSAVKLAHSLDQTKLVDAHINIAWIYSDNYDDLQALNHFDVALSTSIKSNYVEGKLMAYNGLMKSYFYLDSIDRTWQYVNILNKESVKANNLKYQANAYLQMAQLIQLEGNFDSSLALTQKALNLRLQIGDKTEIAQTYKMLGNIYKSDARFEQAIDCYNKEIDIKEEINYNPRFLANAYQNLGNTHFAVGNYQFALEKMQRALNLFEKVKYDEGVAVCCAGVGDIYQNLSQSELATKRNKANLEKSLEYYDRALQIFEQSNSIENKSVVLQSIGTVYSRLATNEYVEQFGIEWEDSIGKLSDEKIISDFAIALSYYDQALEIYENSESNTSTIRNIINVNTNIGSIYNWTRKWEQARSYITRAISLANRNDFILELTSAYYAMGESWLGSGQLNKAKDVFLKCESLSKQLGLKETLRYCYSRLSFIFEKSGDSKNALVYYKNAIAVKDEIYTEKSMRSITEMRTKYETHKKEQENILLRNEKDLKDAVIQRQRLMITGAIVGVALVLLVVVLMFKMIRDKQKANNILKEKNDLITSQKKQITDSILYASSIQKAVLSSSALFDEILPKHFVLYLPKDIVSGDYYWLTRIGSKVVLVAADCTGHGVPGAFMSMLGISFLYEIVNKDGVLKPSEILNNLRKLIKITLGQNGEAMEHKDGMDMSLCVIDFTSNQLEWAGAQNPLYLVREGELIEYTADKMPVAVHLKDYLPFTNHTIAMQPGDKYYIFSDGYADQFGGPDGNKFLKKRFKELLVQTSTQPIEQQGEILRLEHLKWRANTEQIDDILVIGFEV